MTKKCAKMRFLPGTPATVRRMIQWTFLEALKSELLSDHWSCVRAVRIFLNSFHQAPPDRGEWERCFSVSPLLFPFLVALKICVSVISVCYSHDRTDMSYMMKPGCHFLHVIRGNAFSKWILWPRRSVIPLYAFHSFRSQFASPMFLLSFNFKSLHNFWNIFCIQLYAIPKFALVPYPIFMLELLSLILENSTRSSSMISEVVNLSELRWKVDFVSCLGRKSHSFHGFGWRPICLVSYATQSDISTLWAWFLLNVNTSTTRKFISRLDADFAPPSNRLS